LLPLGVPLYDCKQRKDKARPLVMFNALCSFQCFDTDSWVVVRTLAKVEEEDPRRN